MPRLRACRRRGRTVYNCGTGRARTFDDLVGAVFRAAGREPQIEYVDMPEAIRPNYQYFTEAEMSRVRALGYERPFVTLEDGVHDYVTGYLAQADPYRCRGRAVSGLSC